MKQTLEQASKENILFNHRTVDRNLSGKDLGKFGEINFVQGAEWQKKQSPWISVEEQLPEENTGVFFTVEWKDSHKGYFVGLYYGNGQWESDHRIFLPDSPLARITHWMPIPKFNE